MVEQGLKPRHSKPEISATYYFPPQGTRQKLQGGRFHLNVRTKQLAVRISGNEMNLRCDRSPKKNMKNFKYCVIKNGHFFRSTGILPTLIL